MIVLAADAPISGEPAGEDQELVIDQLLEHVPVRPERAALGKVLDQDEGHACIRRQSVQDLSEGLKPAGRSAYADDRKWNGGLSQVRVVYESLWRGPA